MTTETQGTPPGPDPGPAPPWFKTAVIYQTHVRAFADSNGDGIGDFAGLTSRLDYLYDLGVTAVWLLPFYPSPLGDDGYDIADYTAVNRIYGDLDDVRHFLDEAHRRGIRVITEVVLNHTSDQHAWFQRSRRAAPGDPWRDFYVWSDDDTHYGDARIIFQDFETSNWTWDAEAGAYFWHRFYHHQPDLNFDNAAVQEAVIEVVDFWLSMGVDGLRLDAIPYLFEREGTTCENLPETHAFLKKLRAHVDSRYPDRMLLAEANQWPEETSAYFGDGDECHMAFHFPVMPRLYMSVAMEDRFPLVDILEQTPEIPASAQWAVFLRNHDELTLEMVTEEERDYMRRTYAPDPRARINLGIRRRLAPLVGNDRRRIELLNGLLFSLPGTPVVYYGDEIGMGDTITLPDRDGLRTPMQWDASANAGFSAADPARLFLPVNTDPEFRYESVNVAAQQDNPDSLLGWMRQLIALRRQHPVLGTGSMVLLQPENPAVFAYVREDDDETLLVVANLSHKAQATALELEAYAGRTPVELFGHSPFPALDGTPLRVTLPAYSFFWFSLEPAGAGEPPADGGPATILAAGGWRTLLDDPRTRSDVEDALPAVLRGQRWFAGKARTVSDVRIRQAEPLPLPGGGDALVVLVDVVYTGGEPDCYVLPLVLAPDEPEDGGALFRLAEDESAPAWGWVLDGMADEGLATALLDLVLAAGRLEHAGTTLRGVPTAAAVGLTEPGDDLTPVLSRGQQSNSSVRYGDRLILKLFRRAPEGTNPEVEIGAHLTDQAGFAHAPALAGSLDLLEPTGGERTLAVVHAQVTHRSDAWVHALAQFEEYLDRLLPLIDGGGLIPAGAPLLAGLEGRPVPTDVAELVGEMLPEASLLGTRTAELHRALLGTGEDPGFAPAAVTPHFQRSLYQSARTQVRRSLLLLRQQRPRLTAESVAAADRVLAAEEPLLSGLTAVLDRRLGGVRIRTHGDFHLGQVLVTDDDVAIIDFEGEPLRSFGERRLPQPPLRDIASMLRSFQYAGHAGAMRRALVNDGTSVATLAAAADLWSSWCNTAFLSAYLAAAGPDLVGADTGAQEVLLRALLLDKAAYELRYELGHRPDWVPIPLQELLALAEG